MGRLTKRGSVYYADLRDEGRGRVSLRTTDRAVAKERLRKLLLAATNPQRHSAETLEQALNYYVTTTLAGRPAGTVHSYHHKARRLAQGLGHATLISKLTREQVSRYIEVRLHPIDEDDEPAAPSTVYKELVVLRQALKEAQSRGVWEGDLDALVPRFRGASQPRDRWLTEAEYRALLGALNGAQRKLWFVVAVHSGARVGELHGTAEHPGLLWSQVHMESGWIRLPGSKTQGAWRQVPISGELRRWLEAVPEEARRGHVVQGWPNYRRDLRVACKRARINPVSGNDLRRTFASWLLQRGANPLTVARLLGHGSTRMVERIYGQLSLDTYQRAIESLPDCDVCVPDELAQAGLSENDETAKATGTESENAGTSGSSGDSAVPRTGIEPVPRGFSVRVLRLIKGGKSRW